MKCPDTFPARPHEHYDEHFGFAVQQARLQTSSAETLAFVAKQKWESEVATNVPPMKIKEHTKCLTISFSVCGHMLKVHEKE